MLLSIPEKEKYLLRKDNDFVFNPIYIFDDKRIHKIRTIDKFIDFLSFTNTSQNE